MHSHGITFIVQIAGPRNCWLWVNLPFLPPSRHLAHLSTSWHSAWVGFLKERHAVYTRLYYITLYYCVLYVLVLHIRIYIYISIIYTLYLILYMIYDYIYICYIIYMYIINMRILYILTYIYIIIYIFCNKYMSIKSIYI